MIKRVESLTGGVNDLSNPENLKDDQLQQSSNYEILGDGNLHKRKDPEQYGDHVSGDSLTTVINNYLVTAILQVSPPYYPVKQNHQLLYCIHQ